MPPKHLKQDPPNPNPGKPKNQPSSKGKAKAKIVDRAILDLEALNYRRDGASFDEIGQAMGCSGATAYTRVVRRLNEIIRHTQETAEQIKAMMDIRLLRAELELMPIIRTGTNREKIGAIQALVSVEARRASLLGLDVSGKIDVNLHVQGRDIDAEIEAEFGKIERSIPAGEIPAIVEITSTVESVAPTNGTSVADVALTDGPGLGKNEGRG